MVTARPARLKLLLPANQKQTDKLNIEPEDTVNPTILPAVGTGEANEQNNGA